MAPEYFSNAAELIDSNALLRVTVDSAKRLNTQALWQVSAKKLLLILTIKPKVLKTTQDIFHVFEVWDQGGNFEKPRLCSV